LFGADEAVKVDGSAIELYGSILDDTDKAGTAASLDAIIVFSCN
jgi:hypothetical protein